MNRRECRIALYSHDTMGLGHMRRNLLLAHTFASSRLEPVTLAIVGKSAAHRFPMPPRGDRIVLPAMRKGVDGYEPASLGLAIEELIALRSRVMRSAVEVFDPDLLIVDNVPRGAMRELDDALSWLKMRGRARVVLGLRDVLDDPIVVRREWRISQNLQALDDYYDQIWIYGDPRVFDSIVEYQFDDRILEKVRYTGYFDQRVRLQFTPAEEYRLMEKLAMPPGELILCLLGGGEDGGELATAFSATRFPEGVNAITLTGPWLPERFQRQLAERAERDTRFRVLEMIPEPAVLISHASRIVAMGGYNSVWEAISFEKPLLVVPRMAPRLEQWIRARRLSDLGLLDVLEGENLTPDALTAWAGSSKGMRRRITEIVPLDGLQNVVALASEVLQDRRMEKGA